MYPSTFICVTMGIVIGMALGLLNDYFRIHLLSRRVKLLRIQVERAEKRMTERNRFLIDLLAKFIQVRQSVNVDKKD